MYDESAIKKCLRSAIDSFDIRGLNFASTWASEQLCGMKVNGIEEIDCEIDNIYDYDDGSMVHQAPAHLKDILKFSTCLIRNGEYHRCANLLRKKIPTQASSNSSDTAMMSSRLAVFLGSYSLYMAGEKVKDSAAVDEGVKSPQPDQSKGRNPRKAEDDGSKSLKISKCNPYLNDIFRDLYPLYVHHVNQQQLGAPQRYATQIGVARMDGFLMFMFAVVVRGIRSQGGRPIELFVSEANQKLNVKFAGEQLVAVPSTIDLFVEAIRLFPWNWSCWMELSAVIVSSNARIPTWENILDSGVISDEYKSATYAGRFMYDMFRAHLNNEQQNGSAALSILQNVWPLFPNSPGVSSQVALAHYATREYDQAQVIFEDIRAWDPYRLQHLETYSNILYVKERSAELSHLAHTVMKIEKYAPESCCVVGNYYSLKAQHERAILYFSRALKLNPTYLSAWTLMGHEFVELRNTAAAVQCYRRAVEVCSTDYRAWYGLGQTYEMLHLYQYALYYFKKAAFLKYQDARMWCAIGNCYSKLGGMKDAILSYERAVAAGDKEGVATRDLARLYRQTGQPMKAAASYFNYLQMCGISMPDLNDNFDASVLGSDSLQDQLLNLDDEKAEGLLHLATYYRSTSDWGKSLFFATKLIDYVGPEGDEARSLVREIRSYSSTRSNPTQSPSSLFGDSVGRRTQHGVDRSSNGSSLEISGRFDNANIHSLNESSIGSRRDSDMFIVDTSVEDVRIMGELSMSMDED